MSVKVHLFLKQCLNNIQLIQFGGTFTKPFKLKPQLTSAKSTIKGSQLNISKANGLQHFTQFFAIEKSLLAFN